MNDAKVLALTKRVMRLTAGQNLTIAEAAAIHINCLVSLAIEAAHEDLDEAEAILRGTFMDAAEELRKPGLSAKRIV